jgi:ABC-type phosphate transport system auxiliary subunit
VYNQVVQVIQHHIGDVSERVLRETTDEVIAILKADNMKDDQKKMDIETMIDKLSPTSFN